MLEFMLRLVLRLSRLFEFRFIFDFMCMFEFMLVFEFILMLSPVFVVVMLPELCGEIMKLRPAEVPLSL